MSPDEPGQNIGIFLNSTHQSTITSLYWLASELKQLTQLRG